MPPIVSKELWEKANRKLNNRSKKSILNKKYQEKYALSGKLYCIKHKCGYVRRIKHYKAKGDVVYWVCKNYNTTGIKDCENAICLEEDIYEKIINKFKKYNKYKDDVLLELLNLYKEAIICNTYSIKKEEIQKEIKNLMTKKEKIIELTLDELISKKDMKNKIIEIETEIKELKLRLNQNKNNIKKEQYLHEIKEGIIKNIEINKSNIEQYINKFWENERLSIDQLLN